MFPIRPVHLIVPFGVDGASDRVARLVAAGLSQQWGHEVRVENRPGNGAVDGTAYAASAVADGHSLLFGTSTTHCIAPLLRAGLPYAPERDFAPVGLIGWAPNLVLVRKGLADSVAALIEAARTASPPLRYASAGTGQTIHLSAALFERMAGVRMAHVPFETGSAAGLAALVRGEVDVMFDNLLGCRDALRRGAVRALAVAGSLRSSALPDLPTLDECGLPGYRADIWMGLFAPGETPTEVLSELRRALGVVLGQTDVVAHLREAGLMLDFCSGDEFSEEVAANRAAWQSLIESCET